MSVSDPNHAHSRPQYRVCLSHFTADRWDADLGRYESLVRHQVSVNGSPVCPELADGRLAQEIAEQTIETYTHGRIAGLGRRAVTFEEWDGDLGRHVQEPFVIAAVPGT